MKLLSKFYINALSDNVNGNIFYIIILLNTFHINHIKMINRIFEYFFNIKICNTINIKIRLFVFAHIFSGIFI